MNTPVLITLIVTYVLGLAIMFLVPEGWMPKGNTPDRAVMEKGIGRKAFAIGGAIVIAIVLMIRYFAR